MGQLSIFHFTKEKYKIKKPIIVVELFAGIGSQFQSLKDLGLDVIKSIIVEFDKYAILSYNAIHDTNFETRDITKISGKDLEIVDTDKYDYILTYSFPCQDLSLAGKRKGMTKGDNTRSGLLWEVERLLEEAKELPQILLMENVPEVAGKGHKKDFRNWQLKLEQLGYTNHIAFLNAKDYGIPQNRNRCYMLSILGDYHYDFPKKMKLKLRLKDFLEDEVDEKYYLSDKMMAYMTDMTDRNGFVRGKRFKPHTIDSEYAYAITTNAGNRPTDNFIIMPENTKKGYAIAEEGDGVYLDRPHQKRGVVQKGMIQTIKTSGSDVGVVVKGNYSPSNHNASRIVDENGIAPAVMENHGTVTAVEKNLRIRKLTPRECWRLMGFKDEAFEKASKVNSNAQLYKQAGNSIVVDVLKAIFKELL